MDLDTRAAVHRSRLVNVLRDRGVIDPAILAVFAKVPRHRFVEQFWVGGVAARQKGGPEGMRVVDDDTSAQDLDWIYDADAALLGGPLGQATTSLSGPFLIAGMLKDLELVPGMRVLEIGAGSGYHAALMSTLVGAAGSVVTVDIDSGLVEAARRRLDELGFVSVAVIAADGVDGVPGERFDRIVATAGCMDIAPAWEEQLAEDGVMLVPLEHGMAHPRVRLAKTSDGLVGRMVGYSGFVPIQGVQAGGSPWRRQPPPTSAQTEVPLPEPLAAALASPDADRPWWNPLEWALGFYVSLRDERATFNAAIADGQTHAAIAGGKLHVGGVGGHRLADELTAIAQDWLELGAPGLDRYRTAFEPARRDVCQLHNSHRRAGPWAISRFEHLQTLTLETR